MQNELQIKLWVTRGVQRKWTLCDVIFSFNLSFVYQILQEHCLVEPSISFCVCSLLLEGTPSGFHTCFVPPQKSGGALFSHLPHLFSVPMKWWNIFRQRFPLIRRAQMGHRRRICLKQKRTLTVRRKKKSTPWFPPSTPTSISILTPRSQRSGD